MPKIDSSELQRICDKIAAVIEANPEGNDTEWSRAMEKSDGYLGWFKLAHTKEYNEAADKGFRLAYAPLRTQVLRNFKQLLNSDDERVRADITKFLAQHDNVLQPEQIRVEQQVITVNLTNEGDESDET